MSEEYLFLPDRLATPPCGWVYDLDGETVVGCDLSDLCFKVHDLAMRRGLDFDHTLIPFMVSTQLCKKSGLNCRKVNGQFQSDPVTPRRFSLGDVVRGTYAVLKKTLTIGSIYVSQGEAERRAGICSRCKFNVVYDDCMVNCMVKQCISLFRGNRSTSYDPLLENCGKCHCFLKVLVHYPLKDIELTQQEVDGLPDNCWKKETQ